MSMWYNPNKCALEYAKLILWWKWGKFANNYLEKVKIYIFLENAENPNNLHHMSTTNLPSLYYFAKTKFKCSMASKLSKVKDNSQWFIIITSF